MPEAEMRLADVQSIVLDAFDENGHIKVRPAELLSAIEYALQGEPPHGEEPEDFEARRQHILGEYADYFNLPLDNRPAVDCELQARDGTPLTTIKTTQVPRAGDRITLRTNHLSEQETTWVVQPGGVVWVSMGPGLPYVPRLIVAKELIGIGSVAGRGR